MSWLKKNHVDLAVIITVLLYSLLLWWPSHDLPYHWDSAGFVINSARKLLETNFNPLIVPDSDFAHPPLLITLLALSWKIFGQTLIVSHLLMLPFLPLLLISAYFLAKKLFKQNVGIATALFCATTPVVLSEYNLIYIDLPMAALTMTGLALWLYQRRILGILFFSFACLIKLPALTIVGGLIIWHLVKKEYRKTTLLLIPLVCFGLWLTYHYQIENWLIYRPGRLFTAPLTLPALWQSTKYFGIKMLFDQGRVWLSLGALLCVLYLSFTQKIAKQKEIKLIMLLFLSGSLLFIISGEFGARYGIFLLPLYYALTAQLLYQFMQAMKLKLWFLPAIFLFTLPFIFSWHPKIPLTDKYEFRPSENLANLDMIAIGQKMALFAQTQYPKAQYFGGFPESYQLTQAYQGYVSTPLNYADCDKFVLNPIQQQIFILHPYSPMQITCNQIIRSLIVTPLPRFEQNGKWLQLFLVNATESAKLNKPPIK